ncbi:hypothetical protein [Actinomadura rubrisoli]|uniref:hypothetical protein n=1 Tax=Actinomadura rubrisoli TaxID=2530368 RepID=UPI001FB836E8|nr:hypothetical protein [Actinomadura rubrisoli]
MTPVTAQPVDVPPAVLANGAAALSTKNTSATEPNRFLANAEEESALERGTMA